MNQTTLIIGLIAGSVGMGYFVYGKKQGRLIPMLAGAGLFAMPYIISNVLILSLVCAGLCIMPFVIKS